jgi:hypothetical protein
MSQLCVYTFEDKDGHEVGCWSTQNAQEAKEHGQAYNYNVMENVYTWEESIPVEGWDFATQAAGNEPEEDPEDGAMGREPMNIDDPTERARLLFTQWHVDEVTGDAEAKDYADRLISRLAEHGLFISKVEDYEVD